MNMNMNGSSTKPGHFVSAAAAATAAFALLSGVAAFTTLRPALAQTAVSPAKVAPSKFLGKSFAECEKVLGKPALTVDPKGSARSYARYYKSPAPGITRVILERLPERGNDGPVSKTVNSVKYHFPPGSVKDWKEACLLSGMNVEGASEEFGRIDGLRSGHRAEWTTAAASMQAPPRFRHPNDDVLWALK